MIKFIVLLTALATIGTLGAPAFADSNVTMSASGQSADQLRSEIAANGQQIAVIQRQLKTAKAERVATDIFIPVTLLGAVISAIAWIAPAMVLDVNAHTAAPWGKVSVGLAGAGAAGVVFHLVNNHQIEAMMTAMDQLQQQNTEAYKALSDLK